MNEAAMKVLAQVMGKKQSPIGFPQRHPMDPKQQPRDMGTFQNIMSMMDQMPYEGVGGDGSIMEVGNTMDAMDEVRGNDPTAAILEQMMGKGAPLPGEGAGEAAPGWDYDMLSEFITAIGGDLGAMDAMDDASLTAALNSLAGRDPAQMAEMVNTIQADEDSDGVYDLSPDELPPEVAQMVVDSLYSDKATLPTKADPVGKGASAKDILHLMGEDGRRDPQGPLEAHQLMDILGGDLDGIEHLFPDEYWDAMDRNDDDAVERIATEFVLNNPEAVYDAISDDHEIIRERNKGNSIKRPKGRVTPP